MKNKTPDVTHAKISPKIYSTSYQVITERKASISTVNNFTEVTSDPLRESRTCINVANASSSLNSENLTAQSSTSPKAVLCLSASSKTESRYKNLCQILFTFANLNSISVSLNAYRKQTHQLDNFSKPLIIKRRPLPQTTLGRNLLP